MNQTLQHICYMSSFQVFTKGAQVAPCTADFKLSAGISSSLSKTGNTTFHRERIPQNSFIFYRPYLAVWVFGGCAARFVGGGPWSSTRICCHGNTIKLPT